MNTKAEMPLGRLNLSGVVFDRKGVKRYRLGPYKHRWRNLRSVAIETPVHKGHLIRVLVLEFLDNSIFAIPIDRGFKNTFILESVLKLLKEVAMTHVRFSGLETVLGIRDRYLALGGSSNDDDRLIVRARVLMDALELKRVIRLCDGLIQKRSRWEQAARSLKVRALLYCGCFIAAKKEIHILEEYFEEERGANPGLPLNSLKSEQPSGAWYARMLLDEYERHIIHQGVELCDLLTNRRNYDDVVNMIESIKMKFPLEKLNLDETLEELYRERTMRRDFRGYLFGRFRISRLMTQFLLIVVLGFVIGRYSYQSIRTAPDLLGRSERILSLDYTGVRSGIVKVDPVLEDAGFGLKRVSYSFVDPTRDPVYGEVWHHGKSLVFVSEANQILNESDSQVVTFHPRKAWVSEIGRISYKRVIALWLASWKDFQGALLLVLGWLIVCFYYAIKRMLRA